MSGKASQQNKQWWARFQQLLDDGIEWPSPYVFKFIVPRDNLSEVERLFHNFPIKVRESSKGNYASVTANIVVHSSDEVIAMYTSAAKIEGIILL